MKGAAHQRIDVAVIPHIDCPRGARPDRNRTHRDDTRYGFDASRRQQQADEGGENHERHHPRFEQGQIIRKAAPKRRAGGSPDRHKEK